MVKKVTDSKTVKDIMARIEKKYGSGTISTGMNWSIDRISTGILAVDLITGGGIPVSRITEVFGDPSTGKTLLALQWLSVVQKSQGTAVYIATEDDPDPDWAAGTGLDVKDLIYIRTKFLEEIYDIIQLICESHQKENPDRYLGIVLDSIANAESKEMIDTDVADIGRTMNLARAKVNADGMRRIARILPKTRIAVWMVNHMQKSIDPYASMFNTPGGTMVKYNAALRLALYGIKPEDAGIRMRVKVIKSKICPPGGKVEIIQLRSSKVNWYSGLLPLLVRYGHVKALAGGWYEMDGNRFQAGKADDHLGFERFLGDHPEILRKILNLKYIEGRMDDD